MKVGHCDVQRSTVEPVATALEIPSQHPEPAAVCVHLKAASETEDVQDCTSTKKKQLFMNPLFVSPVEEGASLQRAVIVDSGRQRIEDERAFSDEPRGMSQPDFTRLPFFLLPTLPLTFSPCVVGS